MIFYRLTRRGVSGKSLRGELCDQVGELSPGPLSFAGKGPSYDLVIDVDPQ